MLHDEGKERYMEARGSVKKEDDREGVRSGRAYMVRFSFLIYER
jgi:hypothetical protein